MQMMRSSRMVSGAKLDFRRWAQRSVYSLSAVARARINSWSVVAVVGLPLQGQGQGG